MLRVDDLGFAGWDGKEFGVEVARVLGEEVASLGVGCAIVAALGVVWEIVSKGRTSRKENSQNRSRLKRPPLPILDDTSRGLLSRSQSLDAESASPGKRQPEPMMAIGSLGYAEGAMFARVLNTRQVRSREGEVDWHWRKLPCDQIRISLISRGNGATLDFLPKRKRTPKWRRTGGKLIRLWCGECGWTGLGGSAIAWLPLVG